MKNPNLTGTQQRVFQFLKDHLFLHGSPPTRQEIATHFQWASPNAAECHLRNMAAKGFIALRPMKTRAIEILK
jgi:repressor LexA